VKLRAIIIGFVDLITRYRREATVANDEMRQLSPRSFRLVKAERDEFEQLLVELVREGQRTGEFTVEDPQIFVRALLGMMNWCYLWLRQDGPIAPRDVGAQMANVVLDGVSGRRAVAGRAS
jgi:hypothetical protein